MKYRDRDRIQTCNRLIRSQLLYSVELRDLVCLTIAKVLLFPIPTKYFGDFFRSFFLELYQLIDTWFVMHLTFLDTDYTNHIDSPILAEIYRKQ